MSATPLSPLGRTSAAIAALLGLGQAALSAYWALGGTRWLDTVGGLPARIGGSGGTVVVLGLWAVVALKSGIALAAPVLSWRPGVLPAWTWARVPRTLGWIAGIVLAGYGTVLTLAGLAVLSGVLDLGTVADPRALRWHALVWDPWFALWGIAMLVALAGSSSRHHRRLSPDAAREASSGARA